MSKAEEYLKNKGYFQSPHFPLEQIARLMQSFADEQNEVEVDTILKLKAKLKEAEEKNKPKKFTIDFNGNVKCLVRINNNIPYIKSAVNSYGESIDILDIAVYLTKENELKKQ